VSGWLQKLSSSKGVEVIKYYFLSLCGNLILKSQETPIILHIEGKMKIVKHIVTSTAIPSPVGEILMTRHSAKRQLARPTQQRPAEKASSDILPLNMGGHMTNTGTSSLVRSSYLEKRGSQSPQRIKSLKLETLAFKSVKLFHIPELEIE
jgi:hypothetical protein